MLHDWFTGALHAQVQVFQIFFVFSFLGCFKGGGLGRFLPVIWSCRMFGSQISGVLLYLALNSFRFLDLVVPLSRLFDRPVHVNGKLYLDIVHTSHLLQFLSMSSC